MRARIKDAIALNNLLASVRNQGIEPSKFVSILILRDELAKAIREHTLRFRSIMDDNGVQPDGNEFDWKGHPEEREISTSVQELFSMEVELGQVSFLTLGELAAVTHGMTISQVEFIGAYLSL